MNNNIPYSSYTVRFGSHFEITTYTGPDGGIRLQYSHHGIDLNPDPDGRYANELIKIAKRFGVVRPSMRIDKSLLDTWTCTGLGIDVVEFAGRSYLDLSLRRSAYRLDATVPNGPMEQVINALRRKFPDRVFD